MKSNSVKYEIVRIYIRFAFWLTHKKIVVTGIRNIPQGKPVIFAPNHQNALMDPLALVCTNQFQTVWLARADIFRSKTFRPILKFLKIMPIYRIRDGKENLSNNEEIFNRLNELLENKQTIALFPEAAHSGKRKMLSHKKAIPRIALEAENKNNFQLDLQIVPTGIFYSHYWHFNRSLIVQYGEPIPVEKYKTAYVENPQKTMLDLRDEIYEKLCSLVIQIESEEFYFEYEMIRQLAGEAYSQKKFFSKNPTLQLFYAEKELIAKLEQFEKSQPDQFNQMIEILTQFKEEFKKVNISKKQLEKAEKWNWKSAIVRLLLMVLSLPFFAFGFVFNAIPFLIPRIIAQQKIRDLTFLSSFNYVIGIIVFPLYYLISFVILFLLTKSGIIALTSAILMPFLGKIAYLLFGFYKNVFRQMLFLMGNKKYRAKVKILLEKRRELLGLILEKANS